MFIKYTHNALPPGLTGSASLLGGSRWPCFTQALCPHSFHLLPRPCFLAWGLRHTALTFWLPDPSVGFLLYCGSALEGGGRVGRIAINRPSEIMGSQASSRS